MAATTGAIEDSRMQATIVARTTIPEHRMADAIRMLAIDTAAPPRPDIEAPDTALPLGMAVAAMVLWTRFHKFDAADPRWPDRDRFVLSAGHGAMLLYAMLHLTGHDGMDLDELCRLRGLHVAGAAHPEFGVHPAIETSTGPVGQGLAAAVGMALAERVLAARFGRSLVDHRTWVIASDGDLMEGVSHEAASLAGHLRLEKLTVIWDDSGAASNGEAAPVGSEDHLKRFAACGWAVKQVDGEDTRQIEAALSMAIRAKKPTLIACRTAQARAVPGRHSPSHGYSHGHDGFDQNGLHHAMGHDGNGAPASANGHGAPDTAIVELPDAVIGAWRRAGMRGAAARRSWLKRLARHPLRAEFERAVAGRLPETFRDAVAALKGDLAETRPALATGAASQRALAALGPAVPELIGGSADDAHATGSHTPNMPALVPGSFGGRFVHYGIREHGMAAAMNGMALHGGLIPYAATSVVFSDYMRPALRLAAIMRQRVIHVLTHDSRQGGENGPASLPVEQLAGLRAMPNTFVFRPADAIETIECWELALRRGDGPSLLVLSGRNLPSQRSDATDNRCARGGYVLAEADGPRQATLIASGPELALATWARDMLAAEGVPVAVVSLPCWELFAQQDASYRAAVLGAGLRIGIEAACGFGWERWLGPDGIFIGISGFGAAGPGEDVYRHFGITTEAIANAVRRRMADAADQERTRTHGR